MSEKVQVEEKQTPRKRSKNIPKSLIPTLKQEYLKGTSSVREIAQKYNVPERALEVRCSREKWRHSEERIVEKVVQNIEKRDNLRLERLHLHEDRMISRMEKRLETVDKTFSQIGELVEPQDLKSLVGTEAQIDQVIRRNLGANEEKPQSQGGIVVNIVATLEKVWGEVQGGKARVWDVEAVKLAAQKLED